MAQNQQEHILSLMAMVREEEERNDAIFRESPSPQKTNDVGKISANLQPGSESMVLLLSNERIAVLERQLMELQGEKNAKEVYKAKEAKARSDLDAKTEVCDALQSELQHLKLSLRQVRELLRSGGSPKILGDILEGEGLPDKDDQIDDIIQEALHPPAKSPRKRASNRSRLSVERRLKIATPPARSPKIRDHVILMHSDSEDDEEAPAWAGDIMKDLALIAEGEMPPALRSTAKKKKRPPVSRKKGSKNKHASESTQGSALKRREGSVSETSSVGGNVFERLNDPAHFTGIQKVSFMTASEKHVIGNKRPSSSHGVKNDKGKTTKEEHRRSNSGSNHSEDINLAPKTTEETLQQGQGTIPGLDLQLPNHNAAHESPGASAAVAEHSPKLLSTSSSGEKGRDESENHREWVAEYTRQDVFERLTKKETVSFSAKHQSGS
uniref:Uncharacterized protein n=1 Tax=Trieres chinensis TaxID=1514140 RepID=A0A7S1ZS04_TRICV